MLICHSCGAPIENRVKQCHHCHNSISTNTAIGLAESETGPPLKIQFKVQPEVLNRLTAQELIKATANGHTSLPAPALASLSAKGGNGRGNGNGNKFFLSLPDTDQPLDQEPTNEETISQTQKQKQELPQQHLSDTIEAVKPSVDTPVAARDEAAAAPKDSNELQQSEARRGAVQSESVDTRVAAKNEAAAAPPKEERTKRAEATGAAMASDGGHARASEGTEASAAHKSNDFFAQLPDTLKNNLWAPLEVQLNLEESSSTDKLPPPDIDLQDILPGKEPEIDSANSEKSKSAPVNWLLSKSTHVNGKEKEQVNTETEESVPKVAQAAAVAQAAEVAQTAEMTQTTEVGQTAEMAGITEPAAHRRSFSGVNIDNLDNTDKTAKTTDKQVASAEIGSIFQKLKAYFLNSPTINKQAKSTEKNPFFSFQSSWQMFLFIGIVGLFLLFKGFEAFYTVGSGLLSNLGQANIVSGGDTSISGRWQFAAKWDNAACQGQIIMHQHDNQVFGQGIDQYGQYKFSGNRSANHLDLLKQYFVGNTFIGHPIELHGDLDSRSKPLFISGDFKQEYMQGGKWRGKPVIISGAWEAEMIQPIIEEETTAGNVPFIHQTDQRPASTFTNFFGHLSKYGGYMAVTIIVFGVLLWHLASSLIGPDGWLGIWYKQKYVPAQFMAEHNKEKRQLSKPLMPGSLPLGQRSEWHFWQTPFFWIPRYLAIPPDLRANNPHVLLLGGGEKGKSRLMSQMIAHDIDSADRAVIVVDSDGGMSDLLLRWIAAHPNGEQLAKRVIVIDPTSNVPLPSFNPLELPDDGDLQNAAASIVHGFKAIYHEPPGSQNQWSPQTAHILRNAAMLLMANDKTLIDLPTLLQDNDFRDILLEKIENKRKEKAEYATLLETWGQYKRLARTEQWINWYEPILNRVGPTLMNQRIRPVLTQIKGDINLKQIITDKKVLIVKIPKGQLHEDANLLGSLIVTGMKQAAISLCTAGGTQDRTAAMYLDEFDHFIEKETLDAITTETKKFQLGFIGTTKTLQNLPEDFRNQIIINIGTMCVFSLSKKDGDMLGPQMFRVSGIKAKHRTLINILNKVNTSPQFELTSDEEKFNIDRILGQPDRHFYAYRVGAVAGIFRMHSLDFDDIPDNQVNTALLESMYKNR